MISKPGRSNFLRLLLASKEDFEQGLRRTLPDYALEDFDAALRDEPEAGLSLVCAAPNHLRGLLAVFFWLHARDTKAFREILVNAWDHDHREVIAATGTRRALEEMFQAAKFDLPSDWPEQVTLYRGTSFVPLSTAKRGFSWTTDKRVASFFAMRFAWKNSSPLVLRATVPKSSIVLYTNERQEKEAVCFHVRGAQVDGTPDEWEQLMSEFQEESQRETKKRLDELKREFQQENIPCPTP